MNIVTYRKSLIMATENYLTDVFENTLKKEVPIIRSMHSELHKLGDKWETILSENFRHFHMTSFFTHGHPQVAFEHGTKRCEMGDLLYIHFDILKDGTVNKNSLLLQAKVTSTNDKNEKQKELYTTWPKFEFVIPPSSSSFDVQPKDSHSGARYLIIDNETCGLNTTNRFKTDKTYEITNDANAFTEELVDFLDANSGYGRQLKDLCDNDEWTNALKVVEDYAANHGYSQNAPMKRKKDILFFVHAEKTFRQRFVFDQDNIDGMLVVLIFTSEVPIQSELLG
ncbi:hypothetical protein PTQ21_28020 [Paenibacillus marchantiae]|uniref:hypothetical protein n=1 Tax=Paenibacillus marchantiae TaxID=3026433 RepID=UPI00237B7910|nr:hypothetical protein [Paenibacillus marchantiae]WDQ32183.1 hypothetical protein PTQ21_28020 [Paenibacillus marchantiae]